MVYEQLISNMLEQLAHTFELFSTDEASEHTYFAHFFNPALAPPQIAGLPDLLTAQATQANLEALVEPREVFYDRRNRFLDHVLDQLTAGLGGEMRRQFDQLVAREGLHRGQLADVRVVDRAKCLLIQYRGLTEEQAHRAIEKQAMDTRQTRVAVAQTVIDHYDE